MISFKGSTNGGEESFHFPRLLAFAVTLRKQKRFYDDLHTTCTVVQDPQSLTWQWMVRKSWAGQNPLNKSQEMLHLSSTRSRPRIRVSDACAGCECWKLAKYRDFQKSIMLVRVLNATPSKQCISRQVSVNCSQGVQSSRRTLKNGCKSNKEAIQVSWESFCNSI